jgi:hypothetical protein
MGNFWNRQSFLFAHPAHARADPEPRSYIHAELASILQCKPAVVKEIIAELQERGTLAPSPAQQIAQVAIASRCGNSVAHGVFFLAALSVPTRPAKLNGSNELFGGRRIRNPDLRYLESYEGFKTPLSSLKELPETHSFLDLFERLLLGARSNRGQRSILESQGVELGTVVLSGHAVQVTFDYGQAFREFVQYSLPDEMAVTCKDIAQFTKHTIFRLAKLAETPLVDAS